MTKILHKVKKEMQQNSFGVYEALPTQSVLKMHKATRKKEPPG
jgi:hypothetical protein